MTAGVILGATAADAYAAYRTHARYRSFNRPVISAVTINRPPSEVYAFYRQLERLPDFMDWLESVEQIDSRRSHWVAKLPIGGKIEWDAEIVDDRPGEVIEWRTVDGSKVKMRGRVLFTTAPGSQATEVRVEMSIGFTGVDPSNFFAAMFAKPQIKGDLRRLKQVLETGEVIESDASLYRLPHPAQPPSDQPEAGRKEIRVQPSYRRDELVPPEEVVIEEEIVIVPEEVRP